MKKGFTLIEMLAVIIVLGVLAAISIPAVMNNVKRAREAAFQQTITNIEESTQLYIRNNKQSIQGINDIGNTVTITLLDLVNEADFKTPIMDPRTDQEIALTTEVHILVKTLNKYTVTVGTINYIP